MTRTGEANAARLAGHLAGGYRPMAGERGQAVDRVLFDISHGVPVQDVLPYGTWPSPLSAADLAAGSITPGNLLAMDGRLLWTETRPTENGRQALVEWDGDRARDLTPRDFNTRTRVHEYGGAPVAVAQGDVLASRWEDQRLHWVGREQEPEALTPPPPATAAVRYADARAHPDGRWLAAVRERHDDASVANEIVAIDLDHGTETVLVTGRDFVVAPRFSPDGDRLAWLAWDHPYMPWDSAELWVAPFDGGRLGEARHVAGDDTSSVCSVIWTSDGQLVFSQDASGFWEVHVDDDEPRAVSSFGADCGGTAWQLGNQSVAELPDGRLACVVTDRARQQLFLLELDTGATTEVPLRYSYIDRIQPYGDGVVFLAAETSGRRAVVSWTPDDGPVELVTYLLPMSDDDCSLPEPIEVSTPDGDHTNAFLYRPTNAEFRGPDAERPPLLVFTHGGPTGIAYPVLTASIAYWTTRGFAVADVNYRGSTGFGRAYRDALLGRWGELDVMDAIAVAEALAANQVVDPRRMAIRGGSAGGYTTLAVLTTPDHPFACGTSFFGVADLDLLADHTHKFESRYLDRIVGPRDASPELYRQRSPLHRAHMLSRPILILQGADDPVVPPEQAEAMVAAAAEQGVPHAYIIFEGEQHGFRRAESIVTWLESELAFYGEVMGFTPAGDLPELELVDTAAA